MCCRALVECGIVESIGRKTIKTVMLKADSQSNEFSFSGFTESVKEVEMILKDYRQVRNI